MVNLKITDFLNLVQPNTLVSIIYDPLNPEYSPDILVHLTEAKDIKEEDLKYFLDCIVVQVSVCNAGNLNYLDIIIDNSYVGENHEKSL